MLGKLVFLVARQTNLKVNFFDVGVGSQSVIVVFTSHCEEISSARYEIGQSHFNRQFH